MKASLKKELNSFYRSTNLSKSQLNELMNLQNGKAPQKIQWNLFLAPMVAACVAFLFVMIKQSELPVFDQIVAEVAHNHHKNMDPEILSNDLADIQKTLKHLDFTLVASQNFDSDQWTLIGGRYCSIQGKTAAQLKLQNTKDASFYTLYQVPLSTDWNPEMLKNGLKEIDGIVVQTWVEKGLLFALAGPQVL